MKQPHAMKLRIMARSPSPIPARRRPSMAMRRRACRMAGEGDNFRLRSRTGRDFRCGSLIVTMTKPSDPSSSLSLAWSMDWAELIMTKRRDRCRWLGPWRLLDTLRQSNYIMLCMVYYDNILSYILAWLEISWINFKHMNYLTNSFAWAVFKLVKQRNKIRQGILIDSIHEAR